MSAAPALFEVEDFEETAPFVFACVPVCDVCGGEGPAMRENPSIGIEARAVVGFALIAIDQHKREVHGSDSLT